MFRTLITIIKKLWVIVFTNKPYKVRSFKETFATPVGIAVDTCESLSAILKTEPGDTFYYPGLPVNHPVIINYKNGKKRFRASGIFKEPDRFIYSISNGCSLGPLGLVYDIDKRAYIDESAKEWSVNLKRSAYTNIINFPPITKLKGVTFSCLTNGADAGFYHFLFESLIKIQLYQPIIHRADFILFNGPASEWKLKWLGKAGIPADKIIWVDNTSHYECEQLIFSNRLVNDQQVSPWCINALNNLFAIKPPPSTKEHSKVILISRKGYVRNIEWQDMILTHFPEIKMIALSDLNAEETISEMQNATHVIGPHGAGLSNIYLCRPGTKILEIFPESGVYQPCYSRVASICNLLYSIIYLDFKDPRNKKLGLTAFKEKMEGFLC